MNPKRLKQGALAVLFLVLAFVWWRNLTLFQTPEYAAENETGRVDESRPESRMKNEPSASMAYLPPKVNPFFKGTSSSRSPGPQSAVSVPPLQQPKFRDLAQLTGVLERGKESQAILRLSDGRSQVVSLQDRVAGWILVSVAKEQAVFRQNKRLDTLRLGRGM